MASSEKTNTLGLSLWEPTDRPERLDFRQDNERLESLVGGHILNAALHMTTAEKSFLTAPYSYTVVQGTGSAEVWNRADPYTMANVAAIFIFRANKPPVEVGSDGTNHVYFDYCIRNTNASTMGSTPWLSGGGINTSASYFSRRNGRYNGNYYHLNESGEHYIMILLPKTA